jgi:hypothetical protein
MEKCCLLVGNPAFLPYGDAVVVVVASLAQPEWEGNGPKQILFVRKGSHTKAVTHTQRLLRTAIKAKLT